VVLAALIAPSHLLAKSGAPRAVKSGISQPAATAGLAAAVTTKSGAAATTKSGTATTAATGAVTIKDFSFGPATITVHAGDTVTWTNQGPTGHSATADGGSFDTGVLAAGHSASETFNSPGSFPYHCSPHPFMTATIRVLASNSSGGSGSNSGSGSGSSSGSGSGSSASPSSPATSESSAVASPKAGASSSQLASTGFDALPLTVAGLLLLAAGVAIKGRRTTS
jgi:plastocyanin